MGTKYYKHPTYGHVYGESLPTPEGRLAWVYLTKPKAAPPPQDGQPQGEPRYEITLILNKEDKAVKAFITSLKKMTDEMLVLFNKGRSANLGECKLFGKSGDGDEADHEKYPFYKGAWALVARNAKVVKTVGPDRKGVEASVITGGNIGKLVVTPMITAHGISYKLEVVQFLKDDGTKYAGAARDAVELLGACEDGEAMEEEEDVPKVSVKRGRPAKQGKEAALDLL